jgi:hypothetical protein
MTDEQTQIAGPDRFVDQTGRAGQHEQEVKSLDHVEDAFSR